MQSLFPRRQRGITLIEACIAVAIAGVLASSALPSLQQALQRHGLDGAATQVSNDLRFVRSEAIARNEPVRASFFRGSAGSGYVLHTGAAGTCRGGGDGATTCSAQGREIKTVFHPRQSGVDLQANVASVVFDPVHGTAAPSATVRVSSADASVHQVVNIMGRVRSCSPGGSMPGYKPC